MSSSWYWTRWAVRRNALSVVLLVLVLGVGAGGAMAAAAGARRTASSDDRLVAKSAFPEAFVTAADTGTFEDLSELPGVAAISGVTTIGVVPAGVPCDREPANYFPVAVPVAGAAFAVPRPRLLDGRYPDPTSINDALISEQHSKRLRVGVGDRITYVAQTVDDASGALHCGPELVADVVVVGVIRELFEVGAQGEATVSTTYLTPAFLVAHPELATPGVAGFVDLAPGIAPQRFADAVLTAGPTDDDGRPLAAADISIASSANRLQPALDAQASGLWALAAVLALVAAATLAFGVGRQTPAMSKDLRLVAVLGMNWGQRFLAAAGLGLVVIGVGLPLAVLIECVFSTVHLVGLAAIVEPDPGFDIDWMVLAVGAGGVVTVVGGIFAVVAASAATAAGRLAPRHAKTSRPGVANRVASMGAPLVAATGIGYALGRPRRTTLPARSALAGVAVGTAGVLAFSIFGLGVDRASTDSAVYGWGSWDGLVSTANGSGSHDELRTMLAADPDIAAVAGIQARIPLELAGTTVNGTSVESRLGRSGPTVVHGRLPVGRAEIALAGATADQLGAELGSIIEASGPDGVTQLEVVGVVALPSYDGDPLDVGWVSDRAVIDVVGTPLGCADDEGECFTATAVSWRKGADADAVVTQLERAGFTFTPPSPPRDVINIADAAGPRRLAATTMGIVAAAGIAHTLTLTSRRHRRELAIMRALGFDRADVRRVLYVQGLVVGLVGGAVGALIGVVIGRLAWRAAASAIGIGTALPSTAILVAAVIAGSGALGLLLAIVPGVRAGRSTPADALQAEE